MVRPPGERLSFVAAAAIVGLSMLGARWLLAGAAAVAMVRRDVPFGAALDGAEADPLLVGLCQLAGLAVALGLGVRWVHGPDARYREALAVRPVPGAVVGLALLAGLALSVPAREAVNLLVEVAPALGPDLEAQGRRLAGLRIRGAWDAVAIPFAVVAVPAVFEELLYRGLVQPGLTRRYGGALGLGLGAALFAVSHLEPAPMLVAAAAGLLLGWLRERAGSVMACVALHGGFNAAPVLLDPALLRVEGYNTVSLETEHIALPLVLGAAALAGVALTAVARLTEDEG